jgi:DTW domain-containing protein
MRPTCLRCLRPAAFCCCEGLVPVVPRTRVVILQHPREARLAICSAQLAHVAVATSELHAGFRFEDHPRIRDLAASADTALLFPGDAATPIDAIPPGAGWPGTLVVLDATWPQAVKMLRANPRIAALPRLALAPARPSGYGDLRREPGPEHLSTLEAVALALGALEGDPGRYEPMCEAFRRSVERQIAVARGPRREPRHRNRAGSAATNR